MTVFLDLLLLTPHPLNLVSIGFLDRLTGFAASLAENSTL
jgi:hypothetical protein